MVLGATLILDDERVRLTAVRHWIQDGDGVGFAGMQAGPAGQDLGPLAKPRLN